jgi:phage repressor protein C with HTH and peptisase S24 domain
MNGKKLKGAIELSDYSVKEVASLLGVARETLYQMFKRDDIGNHYVQKLKEIGITVPDSIEHKSVPYYELQATAGAITLPNLDLPEIPVGYIDIPAFRDCDFAVTVRGNSMADYIQHGDIIICKRYDHSAYINYGHAYVVVTKQECMVKYIRKGKDEHHVRLVSENKAFDDIELSVDNIIHIHIVKGIIKQSTF